MKFTVETAKFDMDTKWGVAIELERGGKTVRHAVRLNNGKMNEREAIIAAMPFLLDWAYEQ